jgi:hypothetical protein
MRENIEHKCVQEQQGSFLSLRTFILLTICRDANVSLLAYVYCSPTHPFLYESLFGCNLLIMKLVIVYFIGTARKITCTIICETK